MSQPALWRRRQPSGSSGDERTRSHADLRRRTEEIGPSDGGPKGALNHTPALTSPHVRERSDQNWNGKSMGAIFGPE